MCDLKNRLTIGKFSTIDTSNSSREMDANKLHFFYNEFSNIGPTRRTWTWRFKVKLDDIHNKAHTLYKSYSVFKYLH